MTTTEVSPAPAVSRPSSRKPLARPGAPLSKLERRVLVLIADGLTDSQIADKVGVQYDTQKTLAKRIYAKLRAGNRAQAVNQAWIKGLLGPGPDIPAAGGARQVIADLIERHGGRPEWEALAELLAELGEGRSAIKRLAAIDNPPPSWLHVAPSAQANTTSRVAGA